MLRSLKLGISIFYIAVSFTAYAQQVRKLRIDPKQAYGGHVSEYCEDVEYIPLETTKESLFGNINSLIITDTSLLFMILIHIQFYFLIQKQENSFLK